MKQSECWKGTARSTSSCLLQMLLRENSDFLSQSAAQIFADSILYTVLNSPNSRPLLTKLYLHIMFIHINYRYVNMGHT